VQVTLFESTQVPVQVPLHVWLVPVEDEVQVAPDLQVPPLVLLHVPLKEPPACVQVAVFPPVAVHRYIGLAEQALLFEGPAQ
jgi:hypothetical protein